MVHNVCIMVKIRPKELNELVIFTLLSWKLHLNFIASVGNCETPEFNSY